MNDLTTTGNTLADIHKQYVPVLAGFAKDGTMAPVAIHWNRKTIIPVDEVIDAATFMAENGRTQTRYRIRIAQQETYLFLEHQVESPNAKKPEAMRWWLYAYNDAAATSQVRSA